MPLSLGNCNYLPATRPACSKPGGFSLLEVKLGAFGK